MIRTAISALLLLAAGMNWAQEKHVHTFHCEVDRNYIEQQAEELLRQPMFKSAGTVQDSGQIVYIPLKIHWVRNSDGSFSVNDNPEDLIRTIGKINEVWSRISVQLVIDGNINFIDNSSYLNAIRDSPAHKALLANKVPGFANVFIVDGWQGSPASGYGGPGGVELAAIGIQIDGHEFGHFLSLAHTFDTSKGIEKVTRDLSAGGNCNTAGDGFCDTEADPYGLKPGQYLGAAPDATNCQLSTQTTDLSGNLYSPPYNNYMSYYGGCGYIFTPQQYAAMRKATFTYHAHYNRLTSGLAGPPEQVAVDTTGASPRLTWQDASGGLNIQVEYSLDNGQTWKVMSTLNKGNNRLFLGELPGGVNAKIRTRHLNSYTYSAPISFTPAENLYKIPTTELKAIGQSGGIGPFSLDNTSLNHPGESNDSYSLSAPGGSPATLFRGGTYRFNAGMIFNPDRSTSYTYFGIWVDENRDGDFDDPGEQKFVQPKFEYSVRDSFSISPLAATGISRIRVRSFGNANVGDPEGFFQQSETEDYVVRIIEDTPPSIESGAYDSQQESILIQWTDNTSGFGYEVQRTKDGVNYETIFQSTPGAPRSYSDKDLLPNTQYGYRVAKINSPEWSEEFVVVSGAASVTYCTPESDNPCSTGYEIGEFGILEAGYTNVSRGNCQAGGFSDFTGGDAISLNAGSSYTFTMKNGYNGGFEHILITADLDQDGVFEAGEVLFSHDNQANAVSTGIFSIPPTASSGNTVLRVRGYFNPIPDACNRTSYGETEDYTISVSGGKQPAVEGFTATSSGTSSIDLSWSLPSFASGTGIRISQSADGINFTPIHTATTSDTGYTVTGLATGTRYYFQAVTLGSRDSDAKLTWASTNRPSAPPPTLLISSTAADAVNAPFDVTFQLSEPTTGFGQEDLVLGNAAASGFTGSGSDYSVLITPIAEGPVSIGVRAGAFANADGVGSLEAVPLSLSYDVTAPSVAFAPTSDSVTNRPVRINFTASEPLVGFGISSLSAAGGALSDFHVNGNAFNVLFTPGQEGPVAVTLPPGSLSDAAGNVNSLSFTVALEYDSTPPGVTLSSTSGSTVDGSFPLEITFSEPVSDISPSDLEVVNGSVKKLQQQAGEVYTARIIPDTAGNVTVSLAAGLVTDRAGNPNAASNLLSRTFDESGLYATLSTTGGDRVNAPFEVNVTTSAATTDLTQEDLTVVNGSVTAFSGSGTAYAATIQPAGEGRVTVEIAEGAFSDGIRQNVESNLVERTFDSTPPEVVLSWNRIDDGFIVEALLSEPVNGFEASDLTVAKGSVSLFEPHGDRYTFILTMNADGDASVEIPENAFTDLAGNGNTGSNLLESDHENIPPEVILSSASAERVNEAFEVSFSFSEEVVGFAVEDLTVGNGIASSFRGNHTRYNVLVLPLSDGPVTVAVAQGTFRDLVGNPNAASDTLTRLFDGTPPVPTLTSVDGTVVTGSFNVTLSASEPLQGLEPGDLRVVNGDLMGITGSGADYSVAVDPLAIGDVEVILSAGSVADLAGNVNAGEASLTVSFDHEGAPAVSSATESNQAEWRIYPNPATRILRVEGEGMAYYTLSNLQGAVVLTSDARESDVRQLAEGIYILSAYDRSDRLIKQLRVAIQ